MELCSICGASCSSSAALKKHEQSVHDNRHYQCDVCDETIHGRLKLRNHKANHKATICKKCEKSISLNSRNSHITTCQNPMNYKCDKCDYTSTNKGNLKKHFSQ